MDENIVVASFTDARHETRTRRIYQYDYGMVLNVDGIDLPTAFEAHFSNTDDSGTSVTQIGSDGAVTIPDAYLLTGLPVYCWIYLHSGEDDGETVYKITIPVKKRAQPTNEEPTPVQQDAITQAIAALNSAVTQTGQDAESAEASASDAADSAEEAKGYKEDAETAAGNAATSATQAAASATTASQKATQAGNFMIDAGRSAEVAEEDARIASQSANTARIQAQSAQASAQAAQASAQSIQSMNVEAETLAPGSQATAEWSDGTLSLGIPRGDKGLKGDPGDPGDPGFSPTASVSKSGTATTLTVTDKTGTTTATILDGAKGDPGDPGTSPTASVSKSGNKSTITITDDEGTTTAEVLDGSPGIPGVSPTIAVSDIPGGHRITITDAEHPGGISFDVMDGQPGEGVPSGGTTGQVLKKSSGTDYDTEWSDDFSPAIINTASGIVAHFTDGIDSPARNVVAQIVPVQSGSGDPAPDNVRPISGWTGISVVRCGKNVLNMNAQDISHNQYNFIRIPSLLKPGTTYTYSINGSTSYTYGLYISVNGGSLTKKVANNIGSGQSATFTTLSTMTEQYLIMTGNISGAGDESISNILPQIEVGSVATSYEAFTATTYQVSWQSEAGTVYGGYIDLTTGELTVTHEKNAITTETAGNIGVTTDGRIVVPYSRMKSGAGQFGACNILPNYVSGGQNPMIQFDSGNQNIVLWNCQSLWSTKEEFETYIDNNSMEIVYPILTPITYQLTPTEIQTLLGVNNIWADTGDISVDYRADTKTYVDDAPPVKGVTVDGASVVGDDGVAAIPIIGTNAPGVAKVNSQYGITVYNKYAVISSASEDNVKNGTNNYKPIVPSRQKSASFYGLAQASGDTTQSASSNTVGNYTDNAKSAIHEMLSGSITISGTTPTINALPGLRYICGECSTLTVNLPASGCVDIQFESGSTPTVLTVNPASGQTVKWANGFDPTSLDADTTYEINIADGLGVCGSWT